MGHGVVLLIVFSELLWTGFERARLYSLLKKAVILFLHSLYASFLRV